jgi:hypothetical protein
MIREAIKHHKQRRHEDGATVMFDSVTVMDIPKRAPAVAGYVDGAWKTFHMLRTTHPHAWRLPIAVFAEHDAVCLDIENGDARPEEAPDWIRRQHKRGIRHPVPYSSVDQMESEVIPLLKDAGIRVHTDLNKSGVRIFTAHYTFTPHLCGPHSCGLLSVSAHATQWTDVALGRNLDQSLLHRDFFRHPHGKRSR